VCYGSAYPDPAINVYGGLILLPGKEHPTSLVTRATVGLLAGIGKGLLRFWVAWRSLIGSTFDSVSGPGYDAWLVAGSFVPGVVVSVLVFRPISRATHRGAESMVIA
jgi:hypothetical protein